MLNRELTSDEWNQIEDIINKELSYGVSFTESRFKRVFDVIDYLELPKEENERLKWSISSAIEEIQHVLDSHINIDIRHKIIDLIEK